MTQHDFMMDMRERASEAIFTFTDLVLTADELRRLAIECLKDTPEQYRQELIDAIVQPEQSNVNMFGCRVVVK